MSTSYSPAAGLNRFTTKLPPEVRPCAPLFGNASPEGVVSANPGTLFTNLTTDEVWLKVSGVSEVGWKLTGVAGPSATGSSGTARQVFYGTAIDPNGVVTAQAPAYYYSTTDQSQWEKTTSDNDAQGWTKFLG